MAELHFDMPGEWGLSFPIPIHDATGTFYPSEPSNCIPKVSVCEK